MQPSTRDVRSCADRLYAAAAALLAAALLLLVPGTAAAQPAEPCTEARADRVTITRLAERLGDYEGRCVAITGIVAGSIVYADQEAIYTGMLPRSEFGDANPRRVGLRPPYPRPGIDTPPEPGFRRATVTGRVHDCGLDWGVEELEGGGMLISMGSGYCHYNRGAVMGVTSVRYAERLILPRRIGPEAARRIGNIVPAPDDWQYRAIFEPVAAEYRAVLESGDVDRFAEMHGLEGADPKDWSRNDDYADLIWMLSAVFADSGGLADLRRGRLGEPVFFLERDGEGAEEPPSMVIACFFPPDFENDKWPISTADIGSLSWRPYACIVIDYFVRAGDRDAAPSWSIITPVDLFGFVEP
ncbi:hypothetical protein [Stakelama tenebrarum]|uniref:Uncharacterized protein n=1 Tax=Stakelama tenebrarum TaxID=2711215 RepID=A0A6G6Y7B1_9SPHN|nr:hypothetical protein [Sphingosinithalassobacter tenebrarum]QIG80466.1 hypothetical protein G5C33_12205 [Sphingosinithalassobacter tenebrarum]